MRFIVFLIFISSLLGSENQHKIVYLNSGPRALSTVFLRMMESRGDFIVYHEPTIPVYDKVHYKEITEGWFREDAFSTFEDVKQKLFASQKDSNVFVKDMSFSSHDYIVNDEAFMRDPSIYFLFLVRHPHHTSISLYQKEDEIIPIMSDQLGLRKLYEEYEAIRKKNPNGVKIIFSEQLYNEPELTMSAVCHHLGIPFLENAFKWKRHDEHFQGHIEWHEQKVGSRIQHWHGRAIQSEKIGKPNTYKTDPMRNPTFEEIIDENHRVEMIKVYQENLIYHEKFLQAKENHLLLVDGDGLLF